jgi:hypothetical protein
MEKENNGLLFLKTIGKEKMSHDFILHLVIIIDYFF